MPIFLVHFTGIGSCRAEAMRIQRRFSRFHFEFPPGKPPGKSYALGAALAPSGRGSHVSSLQADVGRTYIHKTTIIRLRTNLQIAVLSLFQGIFWYKVSLEKRPDTHPPMSHTTDRAYTAVDTKKHDDAAEYTILAERMDRLTTVLAASAQGHFQRNLVAL